MRQDPFTPRPTNANVIRHYHLWLHWVDPDGDYYGSQEAFDAELPEPKLRVMQRLGMAVTHEDFEAEAVAA